MSAFLVNNYHIGILVAAGRLYGLVEVGEEDAVGECLLSANYRSLAARYGDPEAHEPYRHEAPGIPLDPVVVVKGARCLSYQACEFKEWDESDAKAYLDALEEEALKRLPERLSRVVETRRTWSGEPALRPALFESREYEAAPWEIRPEGVSAEEE